MGRKAVDIVLLPDEVMTDRAIEANRELVEKYGEKIVLNKENCLPHISLAMGCVDERDFDAVEKVLRAIAKENFLPQLQVSGIQSSSNWVGEAVSVFEVEKVGELQLLHEEIMERLAGFLSPDVGKEMLYDPADVEQSTLLWIKNYRGESSFGKYFPHITIGYGEMDDVSFPMQFGVSRLAVCHLGNHCTCREVLISIELHMG
ncbi:MAG: 2'-5' RNA ligase family protein [Planctomycetota bacterium]|jgi:2'-5' RNA ligase